MYTLKMIVLEQNSQVGNIIFLNFSKESQGENGEFFFTTL
jgi:hypothetical protein